MKRIFPQTNYLLWLNWYAKSLGSTINQLFLWGTINLLGPPFPDFIDEEFGLDLFQHWNSIHFRTFSKTLFFLTDFEQHLLKTFQLKIRNIYSHLFFYSNILKTNLLLEVRKVTRKEGGFLWYWEGSVSWFGCQSHFIMYTFYFNMKKGGFPPQKVTMKKVKNMI